MVFRKKTKNIAITFINKPCYSLYALKLKTPHVRIPSKAFQLRKTHLKTKSLFTRPAKRDFIDWIDFFCLEFYRQLPAKTLAFLDDLTFHCHNLHGFPAQLF
jgi:hypothetical protein